MLPICTSTSHLVYAGHHGKATTNAYTHCLHITVLVFCCTPEQAGIPTLIRPYLLLPVSYYATRVWGWGGKYARQMVGGSCTATWGVWHGTQGVSGSKGKLHGWWVLLNIRFSRIEYRKTHYLKMSGPMNLFCGSDQDQDYASSLYST